MNPWMFFFIGVLIGWLIEWIIDWVYWRKRLTEKDVDDSAPQPDTKFDSAREEISKLKARLALCDEIRPHQLKRVKGVGPVIKKKLNERGMSTFAELSSITAQDLEEIVGEKIHRLVDEEEIIRHAKELAKLF